MLLPCLSCVVASWGGGWEREGRKLTLERLEELLGVVLGRHTLERGDRLPSITLLNSDMDVLGCNERKRGGEKPGQHSSRGAVRGRRNALAVTFLATTSAAAVSSPSSAKAS